MTKLASLVVFTDRVEEMLAFYRAVGVALEDEDHGDGRVHAATDVGGVHVAVFPTTDGDGRAPGWRERGSTFAGWWVASLDDTSAALTSIGAPILLPHQQAEWGCRIVVADPDGRAVEINQAGHCPVDG